MDCCEQLTQELLNLAKGAVESEHLPRPPDVFHECLPQNSLLRAFKVNVGEKCLKPGAPVQLRRLTRQLRKQSPLLLYQRLRVEGSVNENVMP